MKRVIGSAVIAALMAASSIAASAAPVAFERAASPIGEAEDLDGEAPDLLIVGIMGALGIAIIALIEAGSNSPDLPVSP